MHMRKVKLFATAFLITTLASTAQTVDPDFSIYLCIGQSNMEGNALVEPMDRKDVPDKFMLMATVPFNNPKRNQGDWSVAVPPLVRDNTGLTPMDYFGRTMLANLPENSKVGVVPVAIGGCKIEHLDKDFDPASLANEADWFKSYMKCYDNYPYGRLIECAKEAQKYGVIRGILLHQGESNNGDQKWPDKVKKIYDDILTDLNLDAADVPLLAGEVVTSDEGGYCGGMNPIINKLPKTIKNSIVVSAENLPQKGDGLHFTAHSYRVLGCRYAEALLKHMGIEDPKVEYSEEIPFVPTPEPSEGDFVFDFEYFKPNIFAEGKFNPETGEYACGQWGFGGWEYTIPIDLSGYKYIVAELGENESDGTEFRVFDTASYWDIPYSAQFAGGKLIVAELDGMMKNLQSGIVPLDTSSIYRVGFWGYGNRPIIIKQVFATNSDPYAGVTGVSADASAAVYDMFGRKIADAYAECSIPAGIYVCGGKKLLIK